jgi:protein phosphatase
MPLVAQGRPTRRLSPSGFSDLPIHALVAKRYEIIQTFSAQPDANTYFVASSQSQKQRMLYESANPSRFEGEQRLLAHQLSHPALIEMEDAFQLSYGDHTRAYLAVEFPLTPMPSLANRSEIEILQRGLQLAEALALVHDKGLAHGNIQPATIYESNNQIKLWGAAMPVALSPEARAQDVYQLAGVLYQLATAPGQNAPAFSAVTMQIFQRALAQDPRLRYADARAFGTDLQQVMERLRHPTNVTTMVGRLSDVGLQRELDEDALLTTEITQFTHKGSQVIGLYAVADGMGGASAGEVASRMVTETLAREVTKNLLMPHFATPGGEMDYGAILKTAAEQANTDIQKVRMQARTDMGSTLVAAALVGNKAHIINVGDSRAYVISQNGIQKITKDHSLVQALVDRGQITEAEIRTHPQRNFILRNVGDKPQLQVDSFPVTMEPGQFLLLCCDGLWEMVQDEEIRRIVIESKDPQDACRKLIDAANAAGGEDNITCVLVRVDNARGSAK